MGGLADLIAIVAEEAARREEYSGILKGLSYSDLVAQCDPDDPKGIPALIVEWQYSEGIILGNAPQASTELGRRLWGSARDVNQRRFEAVRSLVLFIVAKQRASSPDYLRKLWRKHEVQSSQGEASDDEKSHS